MRLGHALILAASLMLGSWPVQAQMACANLKQLTAALEKSGQHPAFTAKFLAGLGDVVLFKSDAGAWTMVFVPVKNRDLGCMPAVGTDWIVVLPGDPL